MPLLLTPGKEVNQFSESALGEALKGTTTGDVIGIKDPSTVRKTRGTRSEGDPIRGGKLFGLREVSTSTSIEKLFNQAGRPTWDLGIKSSPEAVAVFNKQIFPILNFEAEKIIESGVWDELSIEGKNKFLRKLLSKVKSDVKQRLLSSEVAEPKRSAIIYDITSRVSKDELDKVANSFEPPVNVDRLWELDYPQLKLFYEFIKDKSIRDRIFDVDTGLKREK